MDVIILENGFDYIVQIPGKFSPFRLSNIPKYRVASGQGYKEMEAGWVTTAKSKLYLLEMKSWYDDRNLKYKEVILNEIVDLEKYVKEELAKKVVDVLSLLSPNVSPNIDPKLCLDIKVAQHIRQIGPIVLLFVIKARPLFNFNPIKAALFDAINQLMVERNFGYPIDFNNLFVIGKEDFYQLAGPKFNLIVRRLENRVL